MSAMEATVAVELLAQVELGDVLDELIGSLGRRGIVLDGDTFKQGEIVVGRIITREPRRLVIEWRPANWDDEDVTEIELRAEPGRVRLEQRGFGRQFWLDEEVTGWFADEVAASLLVASAPARLGDWLTDRMARWPFGIYARSSYRDPTHHRPSFGAVLEALDLRADDVLVELGCGGGAFLEQALRRCARAAAIDHSDQMVRLAQETNADAVAAGRLEVVQGDAHGLPFADDTFTCAAAMQVFFFFEDPHAVLSECVRVLRPGGRLAVFTVSEGARGGPAAPEPMASRGRFYTDDELVRLALGAGFTAARVDHPDLEPHARGAGLPEDVVALFTQGRELSQLLVAR